MSVLLVLHGVRLAGMADDDVVARRFGLPPAEVAHVLRDARDRGWVQHAEFAGSAGWWLTDDGRTENERLLAAELDAVPGGRAGVLGTHEDFLPLNARLQHAVTGWQLRRTGDRLAANDHTDEDWDDGVLDELAALGRELVPLAGRLTAILARFGGYDTRFRTPWPAPGAANTAGWTAVTSTRATACGSSSTRISWPPSASIAGRRRQASQAAWRCRRSPWIRRDASTGCCDHVAGAAPSPSMTCAPRCSRASPV